MKKMQMGWIAAFLLLAVGCSSETKTADRANAAAPVPVVPAGQVVFTAGSPKLAQIKLAPVVEAEVPSEEVTSPGKVEANPNRTSHVALPVPGRVVNVFVRIG